MRTKGEKLSLGESIKRKMLYNHHNDIIVEAKRLAEDLEKLRKKVCEFYGTMRWEKTPLTEEEYESLFQLVRNIEEGDGCGRDAGEVLESTLAALKLLAATGKLVEIPNE